MKRIIGSFTILLRRTVCIVTLLLLASCNLPSLEAGQSLSVMIIQPADGATLALGAQTEIQSRIASQGIVRNLTLMVNGEPVREDIFSNSAFHSGTVYQPWTPAAVGTYSLQVFLRDDNGQVESKVVTVIVEGKEAPLLGEVTPHTVTPTEGTLTATLTVTQLTETPTATVTLEQPQATAKQNVNCRKGPSTDYGHMWDFLSGQTAPIVGRNQDSSWVVVESLAGYGQCWVWVNTVTIQGSIASLPVITPPPLPATSTPTKKPTDTKEPTDPPYSACHDYPDLATCNADPMGFGICSWDTGTNQCKP